MQSLNTKGKINQWSPIAICTTPTTLFVVATDTHTSSTHEGERPRQRSQKQIKPKEKSFSMERSEKREAVDENGAYNQEWTNSNKHFLIGI